MTASEIQDRASFAAVRYAQCWEDSRLLSESLRPAGKHLLSIGSAGDNSFALLAGGAELVTAVEMNPAQIACIELRKAAYLRLDYQEFLELIGSRESENRWKLYSACRELLPQEVREFWDGRRGQIEAGIGSAGKFENYFRMFRKHVLPLAHSRRTVMSLLEKRPSDERLEFYEGTWNNRRWRWIFQMFFSRRLMGMLGRDPEFFKYVECSVGEKILERTRHALVHLDPAENPYLRWILTGTHGEVLPDALLEENFQAIRDSLEAGRFRVVGDSIEGLLAGEAGLRFDGYNLSDIFEYMSAEGTAKLLRTICDSANPGARLAYWNMLVPRSRPAEMAHRLKPCEDFADSLFLRDRAFFYSRFVVEEVMA